MRFKKTSGIILSTTILFGSYSAFAIDNNIKNADIEADSKTVCKHEDEKKIIGVPYINQNDIVYGCEAVSSTMLLKYYGYDIDEKKFTDDYLIKKDWYIENGEIYGPDPDAAFPGDPYVSSGINCGFGSYSPSTAKSINKVLDGSKHKAVSKKGLSLEKIAEEYINNDKPVLIWATMDMKEPKKTISWTINYVNENSILKIGDKFTWTSGEHCLVFNGYDNENYYFNDPYKNHGLIAYKKSLVEKRYKAMGSQCVYIENIENTTETTNKNNNN